MTSTSEPSQAAPAVQAAQDGYEAPAALAKAAVTLLTLGGTIFMTQGIDGGHAAPDAAAGERLMSTLFDGIDLSTRAIANVSSSDVRPHHLAEVLQHARRAVDEGADGVVLTHGTDTLEETAFLLNRYWDREAPLVVTGAMRPASAPGADGPANLHDAVRTAVAPAARGAGVLVLFDAQVHLADQVTKASSRSVSAFASAPSGPLALVSGAELRLLPAVPQRVTEVSERVAEVSERAAAPPGTSPQRFPAVPILTAGLDEDFEVLDHLPPSAVQGLVIAGVGMGHVSPAAMPRLRRLLEAGTPVVVATRIASGGTSTHHYAYPGSEVDLLDAGAVMAGFLPPAKARLLLQTLLAAGADPGRIRHGFLPFAS
ncbi:asparaginase [Brachybacterium sp. AOP35-5H-19]|uniref:asparaginase n=1 Tax=Brachybacterium sp. AOP35-5H-19 TaxID=3457685 RepID=UPI004033CA78